MSSPLPALTSYTDAVPRGRTARRLDWMLLPPMLRRHIEGRLGSRVVRADSAGAGFTPGFASVLTCADGTRHFVKAASKVAQRPFADAYREEARNLGALPAGLPVPRLLWCHEDDLWVVLAMEYVAGANPVRPWGQDQLEACLDSLEVLTDALTPPPMRLRTFAQEMGGCLEGWDHVRRTSPALPHLDEAAELAGGFADVTAGDTLVHSDTREDNFLLTERGALLCDWSWPVVGATWIDTVVLLVPAHGDGIDADALLERRRLTRDVPAGHVDSLIALVCGYYLKAKDDPVPNSSPYLRLHQAWYADAAWDWLSRRRGWR